MRTLVDIIEQHIRSMIDRSADGSISIQRAELAEQFRCVPSQISYVIDTRFTPERGYIVESRRGGGGYIRIVRVTGGGRGAQLLRVLAEEVGEYIDQRRAENIIERLRDEGFIDERQAALMRGAVRRESIPVELPLRDALRARILYNMLTALAAVEQQMRRAQRGRKA
ncbi:MAG: CtsR family transcriptional regulator [Thermaerobacter sp.]|nr:transcriptional regulator [Bacillota bacterium]REJ33937.1 MAG: transcriptional regulator [Bacillota bacterium]